MIRMGLQQANQNFSKLVRALRQGQSVVLTDRGKPLATVRPVARPNPKLSAAEREEAILEQMEAEGLIAQRGTGRITDHRGWKPAPMRGKPAAETVIEDREERW